MKNIHILIISALLSVSGFDGYCVVSKDSIPSYYSLDKEYFSFTTTTYKYLPNSKKQKVFIYKIFKGNSLVDQYWINREHVIKLKDIDSEFLQSLIANDTVNINTVLKKYNLTEIANSAFFSSFFKIDYRNVRQKKGLVYGCGQDRKGHITTFNLFTVNIKHNNKTVYSKRIMFSQPTMSELKNIISNMIVFYSTDKNEFFAYGEFNYTEDSSLDWIDDKIILCNRNK